MRPTEKKIVSRVKWKFFFLLFSSLSHWLQWVARWVYDRWCFNSFFVFRCKNQSKEIYSFVLFFSLAEKTNRKKIWNFCEALRFTWRGHHGASIFIRCVFACLRVRTQCLVPNISHHSTLRDRWLHKCNVCQSGTRCTHVAESEDSGNGGLRDISDFCLRIVDACVHTITAACKWVHTHTEFTSIVRLVHSIWCDFLEFAMLKLCVAACVSVYTV